MQLDLSKVKVEPLFEDIVDFETFSKSDFRVVKVEACEAVPKSKKLLKFTLNDGTERRRTILSGIHEYYEPEQLVGKTCVAITNLPPRKMMGIDSEGMLISAVYEYEGHEGLNLLMLDKIPADHLWVNPDCGLKTRGETETVASLKNMVQAAKNIRNECKGDI